MSELIDFRESVQLKDFTPTAGIVGITAYDISSQNPTAHAQSIKNLLYGQKWGGTIGDGPTLTYSFGNTKSKYSYNSDDGAIAKKVALTTAQADAAKQTMSIYQSIINVKFKQVTDSGNSYGDIRWNSTKSSGVETAYAYLPSSNSAAGDIWIGSAYSAYKNPTKGSYGFDTFIHEFGHALGLIHPHEGSITAATGEDQLKYSIMSYRSYDGDDLSGYSNSYFPTTPMINDIAALQYLYGANMSYNTANNIYKFNDNQKIFRTIWDAGGIDTIDASNQSAAVKIYLTSGKWSEIGGSFSNGQASVRDCLTIAYNATIENATGSNKNDILEGNSANNTLNGAGGDDSMAGLAGDDTYIVNSALDIVTENAVEGTDTVKSSVTYTLANNIENLTLTGTKAIDGTGNSLDNTIIGNSTSNKLSGLDGNDTLKGSAGNDTLDGGIGDDIMYGGGGNDTYIVDSTNDTITENSGAGTDIVQSSVTWSLGVNFEKLTLAGIGVIDGVGNETINMIIGNDAANKLNGKVGNDTLTGNVGGDTFVFDTTLNGSTNVDTITDFASGVDKISLANTIFTTLSGTLTAEQFLSGASKTKGSDITDRVIYDTNTGSLYYDTDGSGSKASIKFAILGVSSHPDLTYSDFLIA